jgi:hypothetical protein
MAWMASMRALPPTNSATLFTSAIPSALLPDGAAFFSLGLAPGSGMVMSIVVTLPRVERGFSNSASLPTTSSAS